MRLRHTGAGARRLLAIRSMRISNGLRRSLTAGGARLGLRQYFDGQRPVAFSNVVRAIYHQHDRPLVDRFEDLRSTIQRLYHG